MARQRPAAERLQSQRERPCEVCARNGDLAKKVSTLTTELRRAQNQRNAFERRAEEAAKLLIDKKLTSKESLLVGRKSAFDKFFSRTSTAWYDQCKLLKEWVERFHPEDVGHLIAGAMKLYDKEYHTNIVRDVFMSESFKSTRNALLFHHEQKIAEHLTNTNVYTANHFSLLRLVGKLSKRVCSLIEQSIKYKHYADGSKERQMLFPGSRVPSTFSLCYHASDLTCAAGLP